MENIQNIRTARMKAPSGKCSGASVDGINYPPNEDGTVTVPAGKPVAELTRHGFTVVEINDPQEG